LKVSGLITICLILCFSCSEKDSLLVDRADNLKRVDTVVNGLFYYYIDSCDSNVLLFDSVFQESIRIYINRNCLENSIITDTIISSENQNYVHKYHNSEINVNYELNHITSVFSIKKENFLEKEYDHNTLNKSLFGNFSFQKFDNKDTSFYFNIFFGYPDSDFGETLLFKAHPDKGVKLIKIEYEDN